MKDLLVVCKMHSNILVMQFSKTDIDGFELGLFFLSYRPLEPIPIVMICEDKHRPKGEMNAVKNPQFTHNSSPDVYLITPFKGK